MKITPKQYAIGLHEAIKDLPEEKILTATKNFIKFLVKNNALKLASKIIIQFERYVKEAEGMVDLEIWSAKPLDKEVILKIKKIIPVILKKEFKEIKVIEKLDSNLIGGIVLKCDDLIFDASIKNKFRILAKILNLKSKTTYG